MKFKAIIFDLDGTLLNSLTDIADSVNTVLKKYDFPVHGIENYKVMIGNGIETLVERALPVDLSKSDFDKYLEEVKTVYEANQITKTKPYDGIVDMLKEFNNANISLNILSNKPIEFTKMVVEHFLSDIKFDNILGAREGVPKKPNPHAVFEIIENLSLTTNNVLYVGDTGTDMKTADAANLSSVGVLWGFRGLDELLENGAEFIINEPKELINIAI